METPRFFPCPARTDACVCVRPSGLGKAPLLGRERAGAGRNKESLAFLCGAVAPRASSLTEAVDWGIPRNKKRPGQGGLWSGLMLVMRKRGAR